MLPILPPELVSLIINYVDKKDLYNCTLISKQFYIIANPLLWQEPDVRSTDSILKVISGIFVSKKLLGQHVRRLDFCQRLTNAELLLFLKYVPQLEELELQIGHLITDQGFKHVPQHCPNLKILDLCQTRITQQSFDLLGQHCLHLRMLSLSYIDLSPNIFAALVHCPLEELVIRFNHSDEQQLEGNGGQDRMLIPGISQFRLLTALEFHSYSIEFVYGLVAARDPTGQTPWPHLTEIGFLYGPSFGVEIDEQLFIDFIRSHPSITSIYFPIESVLESIMNILPTLLPGLKTLSMECCGSFTDQSLRNLICGLPQLETLRVDGCAMLGEEFPEVDQDCLDDGFLDTLDRTNIDKIRLASGPTNMERVDPTLFDNDEQL